jgi:leader peptidase (prepilin peptidase)/N-methyltransferase
MMAFCAVVYVDLRYLVIPDLYSIVIAAGGLALALFAPSAQGPDGLVAALAGAALCGGMLWAVAWVWKRTTDIEGLGFGDVKLAAAIGAVLGAQAGVWAITASAALGTVAGLIAQVRARRASGGDADATLLIPYGAPLALAGGALLLWERWP